MKENKTQLTKASPVKFLRTVENKQRQSDAFVVLELMKKVTKEEPRMWGGAIIGYGIRHLKYESGRELDIPMLAFSPRKQSLVLYIVSGSSKFKELIKKLGRHKLSGSCLHINKIEDVDFKVLERLMKETLRHVKSKM